jgi:chromosome segregation ATPase
MAADLRGRIAETEAANAPTRAALDELGMRLGAVEQQGWAFPEQLDDRLALLQQELSGRIEGLGLGYDAALAALSGRLEELAANAGTDSARLAGLEDSAASTNARLEELAAASGTDSVRLTGLEDAIASASTRLKDIAAASGTESERLSGLEDAAASTNMRLEGLEARLAKDSGGADQIAALNARFDAELAVAEERGAAVERAIRKGLAGLGERLTASEATYLESGAALRRSIERLGAAVVEADVRLAEMPLDPPEYGFVAFVPTSDGYRLRPLDGAVPAVGDVLSLEDAAGPLRVTRIARSPLPLDRRACAYLARD